MRASNTGMLPALIVFGFSAAITLFPRTISGVLGETTFVQIMVGALLLCGVYAYARAWQLAFAQRAYAPLIAVGPALYACAFGLILGAGVPGPIHYLTSFVAPDFRLTEMTWTHTIIVAFIASLCALSFFRWENRTPQTQTLPA